VTPHKLGGPQAWCSMAIAPTECVQPLLSAESRRLPVLGPGARARGTAERPGEFPRVAQAGAQ